MCFHSVVSKTCQSALHAAAFQGRLETIQLLLRAKADIECRDSVGTAQPHVFRLSNIYPFEFLVELLCPPPPQKGMTPLLQAADGTLPECAEIVMYLIEQRADTSAVCDVVSFSLCL